VPYFDGVEVVVGECVAVGLDDSGTKYQTRSSTTTMATMIPTIFVFMSLDAPLQ
jgi:hypothetical protein